MQARKSLTRQYDATLYSQAKALASLIHVKPDGQFEFDFDDRMMPEFKRQKFPQYFQIWMTDGSIIERSRSLGTRMLSRFEGKVGRPDFRDIHTTSGRTGRAVSYRFFPQLDQEDDGERGSELESSSARPKTPPVTIVVAQSRKPLQRVLDKLLLIILLGALLLPAAGALLVAWSVRRGLAPLDDLARQVQSVTPAKLDHRIAVKNAPIELRPVEAKLNDLLSRLEAAFNREKRFTSDVSHELRTPLAEAMTAVELMQRWPDDHEIRTASAANALEALNQMQQLIERLLLLIRGDAGKLALNFASVDLTEMTRNLAADFTEAANARDLSVAVDLDENLSVKSDPILLRAVLRNLFDNAVSHGTEGTAVHIHGKISATEVEWTIRNSAPALNLEDLPEMFQPFWRKDDSRTGDAHSGVGLALVTAFCSALAIQLHAELRPDSTLEIRLVFPPLD
jgi:two-component system sensor histidine kinase QseC